MKQSDYAKFKSSAAKHYGAEDMQALITLVNRNRRLFTVLSIFGIVLLFVGVVTAVGGGSLFTLLAGVLVMCGTLLVKLQKRALIRFIQNDPSL